MKAWVLHEIGDIRWEEVEQPVPGEQEVLLRVRAAGICGSDVPRIYTSGTYSYPLIPGHEFAGEVVACGEGVSEEWLGQRIQESGRLRRICGGTCVESAEASGTGNV